MISCWGRVTSDTLLASPGGIPWEIRICELKEGDISLNAFNNPPTVPIGAFKIDTSIHVRDRNVYPVHRHCPSIHAPFLLQWYGHCFLD